MAETLFPQRQRCKTCRGNLGKTVNDPVLFGLYCSPKCAGIAEPSANAGYQGTPRECRTRDGGWFFKRRYRSEGEIPDKIRDDPSTNWYWCGHCGTLHVGHTRMGTTEKFLMFEDLGEDLPDLLVKLRGKATLRDFRLCGGRVVSYSGPMALTWFITPWAFSTVSSIGVS